LLYPWDTRNSKACSVRLQFRALPFREKTPKVDSTSYLRRTSQLELSDSKHLPKCGTPYH